MVRALINWALANSFLVVLGTLALAGCGTYAFTHVNIEAYPDPAPAIIEVVAQFPGASAEEVERQVTIPLEVGLAGMPGLDIVRTKSLFGLAFVRNQFDYGRDYEQAKQDVINRLNNVTLPPGVVAQISPASPIGEIVRVLIENPVDPATGRPVYSLADVKTVQDYTVTRELLRVPRIAGVSGVGGLTKRYEVQPDPNRLRDHGVTLAQLSQALGNSNANGSGDALTQGPQAIVVRSLGLIGYGQDPLQKVLAMTDPAKAAAYLRAEEVRRLVEIRQVVVASVNNVPVRVDQLVDGGPVLSSDGAPRESAERVAARGVVVGHQTRQGYSSISLPKLGADGKRELGPDGTPLWEDRDDIVQGVVLLRKGQESLPALKDVLAKIEELNAGGKLPPGMKVVPYYNRGDLITRTTETVNENLVVGMALVSAILLVFLGNVRATIIVAINIPLALLFAFGVLYARHRSANLLSIGAIDFGIIVESSVVIVESIYRHLTASDHADKPLAERISLACASVTKSLFFATLIMVCALLPLFTMTGPEGQIFGPMADTYAFALGGALLLALVVSPVLCLLFLGNVKPKRENFLVRGLRYLVVRQLHYLLKLRWLALIGFVGLIAYTGVTAALMGREFMPELEEGTILIRGTFPVNVSLPEVVGRAKTFRGIVRKYEELRFVPTSIGRPDDGTDPTGYYNLESNIAVRPEEEWPIDPSKGRRRTKEELVAELERDLDGAVGGVDFDFTQMIRDNVLEALSGVKGENSIKVFGPDLDELEATAGRIRVALGTVRGVENAGVFRTLGQSNLEFPVDRQKCARWNVSASDVQAVVETAVAGRAAGKVQEGEKQFDLTVRWPQRLRADEQAILNIPVPVSNVVAGGTQVATAPTPFSSGSFGALTSSGTSIALPPATGSDLDAPNVTVTNPARRLSDLVTPLNRDRVPDAVNGSFAARGASTIYRERGQRLIAIKFEARGRDLASTVGEAKQVVAPLLTPPYAAEWSGEFKQMEAAEARMARTFLVSFALIIVMCYLSFRSVLDAAVVLANVLGVFVGGVWALKIMALNFNISAAVGFISILGVAVMNGLIMVSSFNALRSKGVELEQALSEGVGNAVRPLVMTLLAAFLGLLPAAFSTAIGSQSQRPLAVVVVGGMLATIVLFNLMPLLYSLYGSRTPPEGAGGMAH